MNEMTIFAVYDKPKDYPDKVVVREFFICKGVAIMKEIVYKGDTVEEVKRVFDRKGFAFLDRSPGDDKVLVGTYI